MSPPADGFEALPQLPRVEVRQHLGRPTVHIDGAPCALTGFNTFGRAAFDRSMSLAYQDGYDVYFIHPQSAGGWPDTRFWVGDRICSEPVPFEGEELFDLDEQAAHIMAGDPQAWIMVRYVLWPPSTWVGLHRDELFVAEDGTPGRVPSLASEAFGDAAARASQALLRYCESRPWARRVIGYANFGVCEGTHAPVNEGHLYDRSPRMRRALQDFARRRYGSAEALRRAYGDETLTFESLDVPADPFRGPADRVADAPYWQDAARNRPLRDYLLLQRELFTGFMRRNGAAMQAALQRPALLLHDAFKQVMLGWSNFGFFDYPGSGQGFSWRHAYPETTAASGSMGVLALLHEPGFSGLITPHDYQARGRGGVYVPEGAADSCVLRGRLFYTEMDTRTWVNTPNEIGLARDVREYAANTWRNLATGWTHGFSSYWMEFGAGWFDPPEIRSVMRRQTAALRQSLEWAHQPVPGIAMVLDDTSVLETSGAGNYLNEAVMWEQKMGLARCGVPHSIYLFEDLALEAFPRHRVYYFPNLFRVDAARLELLRERVLGHGAVVVWGPGSGISDGQRIGVESASRLTGFAFDRIDANAPRRVLISDFDHPVTRDLGAGTILGGPLAYGPVLLPVDGRELGLAWTKGGFNHAGLALMEHGRGAARTPEGVPERGPGDYAAVFSTVVNLPAGLWRGLARFAGAHVYCETDDVLLASAGIVALHSLKSEAKRLALPGEHRVHDVIADRVWSHRTREIRFALHAPETRVFRLEG